MGKKIRPRRIFIGATMQNDGKTTVSLGLIEAIKNKRCRLGFIKPVGQRYLVEEGFKVDEDSVLIGKTCRLRLPLKDMNPIAIERGFTERFIRHGDSAKLMKKITDSFNRVSLNKDIVIIEGTGHAGVGSVFGLSNARVARLLSSEVILVTSGGIGKPLDEIALNKALFEKEGVRIAGVIVNKVLPEKYKKVKNALSVALKKEGLTLLGVIPYKSVLSAPRIQHILEETNIKLVSRRIGLQNRVEKVLVGAMEPHDALKYIENGCLLITPGDREDMLMTLLSAQLLKKPNKNFSLAGVILTGGIVPNKKIMSLIEGADIPVLLSKEHTYNTASCIYRISVKIRPNDKDKIEETRRLIEKYVDLEKIFKR